MESVGDFIRLYATRNKRWSSPKFLAGESYGTTRAAGLSSYMQQRFGMYFNGIILISSILNFETAEFNVGNDLPCILYLPTYTAIAWYHKKLPPDLQSAPVTAAIEESRKFAAGEYADALMQGDALSPGCLLYTSHHFRLAERSIPDFVIHLVIFRVAQLRIYFSQLLHHRAHQIDRHG